MKTKIKLSVAKSAQMCGIAGNSYEDKDDPVIINLKFEEKLLKRY